MKKKLRLWILLLPFALFYLGVGSNILVITANKGAMPVVMPFSAQCSDSIQIGPMTAEVPRACEAGETLDRVHRVAQSSDHLKVLEDWIQVPHVGVCSPGDLALWLGDFLEYPMAAAWFALLLVENKKRNEYLPA